MMALAVAAVGVVAAVTAAIEAAVAAVVAAATATAAAAMALVSTPVMARVRGAPLARSSRCVLRCRRGESRVE